MDFMVTPFRYYCLKEGKCFGATCQGCLKHECEIDGTKTIVNPPEQYMKTGFNLKNLFDNYSKTWSQSYLRNLRIKKCKLVLNYLMVD